jgi:hypothetical protein
MARTRSDLDLITGVHFGSDGAGGLGGPGGGVVTPATAAAAVWLGLTGAHRTRGSGGQIDPGLGRA